MKDEYDSIFDISEYTQVRAALEALPQTALPQELSASALFAKMDGAKADIPADTEKPAKVISLARLRRPLAIAASLTVVIAAYIGVRSVGLSDAGSAEKQTVASTAALAESETESYSADYAANSLMTASENDEDAPLSGSSIAGYDNAPAAAPAAGEAGSDAANDMGIASENPENATLPDGETKQGEQQSAMLTSGLSLDDAALPSSLTDDGYTLIADASQSPDEVLAQRAGVTAEQLSAALASEIPEGNTARTNCLYFASDGDRYAFDAIFSAPVWCEECGGDIMTPFASRLYLLYPSGDGYDLFRRSGNNDYFIAHISE